MIGASNRAALASFRHYKMMAPLSAFRFLQSLVSRTKSKGQADRSLVERFAQERDEAAFAELIERHGRMVLGVCHSVLKDEHLAEDAFQATFLILARKAGSIRKNHAVASWLHGVALRLSRKARAEAVRSSKPDERGECRVSPDPPAEASCREVQQILHEELDRLPEKYRVPLVLCYLEGHTRDEAAQQLGWSTGRLKGRLERGRIRLRTLLLKRGITPAGAASAMLLTDTALAATIPPLLASAVAQAAIGFISQNSLAVSGLSASVTALTEGGLKIMAPKKLTMGLTMLLAAVAIATGAGIFAMTKHEPGSTASQQKDSTGDGEQVKGDDASSNPGKEPKRDDKLRYDGKPFEYWRDFAANELKPEKRIEAVRALAAFGARGYADEVTALLVDLTNEFVLEKALGLPENPASGQYSPDQELVREIVRSVHKIDPAAVPALIRSLHSEKHRPFIVWIFNAGLPPSWQPMSLPESNFPGLLQLVASNKDKSLRIAAFQVFCHGSDGIDDNHKRAIEKYASNEDGFKDLLRAMIEIVRERPRAATWEAWPEFHLEHAIEILGILAPKAPEAGPILLDQALKGSTAACKSVLQSKLDPKVVVDRAIQGLKDDEYALAAVHLLAEVGKNAKPAIRALLKLLASRLKIEGGVGIQIAIIECLEKIDAENELVASVLRKVSADEKQQAEVREAASRLLEKLEKQP